MKNEYIDILRRLHSYYYAIWEHEYDNDDDDFKEEYLMINIFKGMLE